MEGMPKRKPTRMQGANYSDAGAYFVTICTQGRKNILSHITWNNELIATSVPVGTGVHDGPQLILTKYGKIADKYIRQMNAFYEHISVESYVIMPNHIHLLLLIKPYESGPSGTPVPTLQNSYISKFVSTFKRFCNKEFGENLWQYRSYDHIIRSREDYEEHLLYIHENPMKWAFDELYIDE